NVIRILVGEAVATRSSPADNLSEFSAQREPVTVLEASVDDLNPQVLAYALERALAAGALDAFAAPLHMKKNRSGMLLTVLANPAQAGDAGSYARLSGKRKSAAGRFRAGARMSKKTSTGAATKFYITTPIFYVNSTPHIGHAYTTIACDAVARYHRMLGEDTLFLTGTDEHGQKIERSAAAAGIPPKQFTARIAGEYRALWDAMGIAYDDF